MENHQRQDYRGLQIYSVTSVFALYYFSLYESESIHHYVGIKLFLKEPLPFQCYVDINWIKNGTNEAWCPK